jgi:hypothetical protein
MSGQARLTTQSRAARFDERYPFFKDMRAELYTELQKILDGMVTIDAGHNKRRAGIETEYTCVYDDGSPLTEEHRNAIVTAQSDCMQTELGASQIEVTTPPVDLSIERGATTLLRLMKKRDRQLLEALRVHGAVAVGMGTNPLIATDDSGRTHSIPRYLQVPDFHDANRRTDISPVLTHNADPISVDRATIVGAMSSIQVNLDVGAGEAIDLLNRSFVTGPFAVALGANARYIEGRDSGFADVRGAGWETSHDIRTPDEISDGVGLRVGLPGAYFSSLEDYFIDLHDQPSILNNPGKAFETATGLYWRDARLKFLHRGTGEAQTVLEFRPVSLQPTVEEDYALMMFAIGHVLGARELVAQLLPLPLVADNRWAAMRDGLHGKFWIEVHGEIVQMPGAVALPYQFGLATEGLRYLGVDDDEIEEIVSLWKRNVSEGAPSERIHARFMRINGSLSMQERFKKLVLELSR